MRNHEFIHLPGGQIINLNLVHDIEQVTRTKCITVQPHKAVETIWIKIDGKLYEDPEGVVFGYFKYKGSRPFSSEPRAADLPEYQAWGSK